jgi:hypothetical protein
MLICYIYSTGAYAKTRNPLAYISRPTTLGPSEIDCLSKYLRSFDSSHPSSYMRLHLIQHGDLHYFLTAVFFGWDTDKEIGPQPVLRERVLTDYAFRAGLLNHDIGPIINKDGLLDESGRRLWDYAYMAFKVDQITLEWRVSWVDRNGNAVERDDVDLFGWLDYKAAVKETIKNFDKKQNQRIMAYN